VTEKRRGKEDSKVNRTFNRGKEEREGRRVGESERGRRGVYSTIFVTGEMLGECEGDSTKGRKKGGCLRSILE